MFALAFLGLLLLQEPDIAGLLKQLSDESIEVRDKATKALVGLGEKAEPAVKAAAGAATGEQRNRCLDILKQIARGREIARIGSTPPLVTIEARDLPLSEVLKTLESKAGFKFSRQIPGRTVTLSLKDALPLEALEAVCRAAGTGYTMGQDYEPDLDFGGEKEKEEPGRSIGGRSGAQRDTWKPIVMFRGLPRRGPFAVTRRYKLALTDIRLVKRNDFSRSVSQGELRFYLVWEPGLRPHQMEKFEAVRIEDDQDRVLFDISENPPLKLDEALARNSDPRVFESKSLEVGLGFRYPEADAKRLKTIRVRASFLYPIDDRVVRIDKPYESVGKSFKLGAVEVTLTHLKGTNRSVDLAVDISGIDKGQELGLEDIRIVTAKGAVSTFSSGGSGGHQKSAISLHKSVPLPGEAVEAIEVVVGREFHKDTVEFDLKDIPLPK